MQSFDHTVEVKRMGSSIVNKKEIPTGYATVYAAVKCMVEPVAAWRKATVLGVVGRKRFVISWEGSEDLRDGDLVVWDSREYRFEYGSDDRYRTGGIVPGYQTGHLHQEGA